MTACGRSYLNPGVEDVVFATFHYPNNVASSLHASWLNPRKVREITIVGETKMVVMDDITLTEPLRIYHKSVAVEREPRLSDSFGSFRMQIRNGDIVVPNVTGPEPLVAECDHFIDCVRAGPSPSTMGRADSASCERRRPRTDRCGNGRPSCRLRRELWEAAGTRDAHGDCAEPRGSEPPSSPCWSCLARHPPAPRRGALR